MTEAPFGYARADSVEQALALLADSTGEVRPLAGGQTLLAAMNLGLASPERLIDIGRIEALRRIERHDRHLVVGAAVTQTALLGWEGLREAVPLLAASLPLVGHEQTRNRGTVGGSVAHADPSAELPLCLVTLGGEIVLASRARGERTVPAETFFTGVLSTARADDELILALRFPLARPGHRYEFTELSIRHGDYAIVALAAVVGAGSVTLGVGGVADRPVRFVVRPEADLPAELERIARSLDASDDVQASAVYRRHLVRELGRRLLSGERAPPSAAGVTV